MTYKELIEYIREKVKNGESIRGEMRDIWIDYCIDHSDDEK